MSLQKKLNSRKRVRVIGFDDAPFCKLRDRYVKIAGVVCSNTRFEGMLWGEVTRDGFDVTDTLVDMLVASKFYRQLDAVLLDGIAVAGFNIVQLEHLHARLMIPCIAVMRKFPDLAAIHSALRKLPQYEQRRASLAAAGDIYQYPASIFQCRGCDEHTAARLLQTTTDTGKVPEALRLAHLIGAAVSTGTSGRRALTSSGQRVLGREAEGRNERASSG